MLHLHWIKLFFFVSALHAKWYRYSFKKCATGKTQNKYQTKTKLMEYFLLIALWYKIWHASHSCHCFFLWFCCDEISVYVYAVLGVLLIPCNHHQTEQNACCCGEQGRRSAQTRLCLRRGGTVTQVPGSCGGRDVCLFWHRLQHVSHVNGKNSEILSLKSSLRWKYYTGIWSWALYTLWFIMN